MYRELAIPKTAPMFFETRLEGVHWRCINDCFWETVPGVGASASKEVHQDSVVCLFLACIGGLWCLICPTSYILLPLYIVQLRVCRLESYPRMISYDIGWVVSAWQAYPGMELPLVMVSSSWRVSEHFQVVWRLFLRLGSRLHIWSSDHPQDSVRYRYFLLTMDAECQFRVDVYSYVLFQLSHLEFYLVFFLPHVVLVSVCLWTQMHYFTFISIEV